MQRHRLPPRSVYESIHFNIYDLIEREDVRRLLAALWYSRWETAEQIVDGLKEIRDPKKSKILRARLKHEDPLIREKAAFALGRLGQAEAVRPLSKALKDRDWAVRREAVKALAELRDTRAVRALATSIADEEVYVRREVVDGLRRAGDALAVRPLTKALQDNDPGVRALAASAMGDLREGSTAGVLGDLKDRRAVQPLIRCLQDMDSGVRHAAVRSLGVLADKRAVGPLISCLRDSDLEVRRSAVMSLGKIGDARAAEPIKQALWDAVLDREAVDDSSKSGDESNGEAFMRSLGGEIAYWGTAVSLLKLGDVTGLELLLRYAGMCSRAQFGVDFFVHCECVFGWEGGWQALPKLGRPARDTLLQALNDENPSVRRAAIRFLGPTEEVEGLIEPLISALGDSDEDVQEDAAGLLEGIGGPAINPLIKALSHEEPQIRRRATKLLEEVSETAGGGFAKPGIARVLKALNVTPDQVGRTSVVKALIGALSDVDGDVRRRAAHALGRIGDAAAAESLARSLKDPEPIVRQAAGQALSELGAIGPLLRALREGTPIVRLTAAHNLGRPGNTRAVGPLIRALRDEYREICREAADALGRIGDARAVRPLIHALQHEASEVRRAATASLSRMGDMRAVRPILETLKDEDEEVRSEAAIALAFMWDARAVDPLLGIMGSLEDKVGDRARDALKELGELAVEPLMLALQHVESFIREKAALVLGEMKETRAIQLLVLALKDVQAGVRQEAASALGEIGDARAIAPLVEAAKDDDETVRERARSALKKIRDPFASDTLGSYTYREEETEIPEETATSAGTRRPLAALLNAVDDADPQIRRRAATDLGDIRDTRAIDALYRLLYDEDAEIRHEAAVNLGWQGVVEPLIQALQDQDPLQSVGTAGVLGHLYGTRAIEHLINASKHSDEGVRREVKAALENIGGARAEKCLEEIHDAEKQCEDSKND